MFSKFVSCSLLTSSVLANGGTMEFEHASGVTSITQLDDLSLQADASFASTNTVSAAHLVSAGDVNASKVTAGHVRTGRATFNDGTFWEHGSKSVTQSVNLIDNGAMRHVNPVNGKPKGFSTYIYSGGASTIQLEAVHPNTKAFEGPYRPDCTICADNANPSGDCCVNDPEYATGANPYYFGRYNCGPRMGRGGLANGWGALGGGHILKATGTRTEGWVAIHFPKFPNVNTEVLRFSFWIKMVKGHSIKMQTDYGGSTGSHTKAMMDTHPQGWYYYDELVWSSRISKASYGHAYQLKIFGQGGGADGVGEFEVYIALPHMSAVEKPHNGNYKGWVGSPIDMLADRSFHVDLDSHYVGIQVADPTHMLHVNGEIRSTSSTLATTSDQRLKNVLGDVDVQQALARVQKLRVVNYQFKPQFQDKVDGGDKSTRRGFLAQEVEKVLPEAVKVFNDTASTGLEDLHIIQEGRIFTEAVAAVQGLAQVVEAQNTRIQQLEGQVHSLLSLFSKTSTAGPGGLDKTVLKRLGRTGPATERHEVHVQNVGD